MNLISHIHRYAALQEELLKALTKKYGIRQGMDFALNFPRTGAVEVDGSEWTFRKHGFGVRFKNKEDIIIDVENHLSEYKIFNLWRLSDYINSINKKCDKNKIENCISNLISSKAIKKTSINNDLYYYFDDNSQ